MIKANELRIGNLINVINLVPVVVTSDHIKSIAEGDKDYSPIPLTPEWLERCGFEYKEPNYIKRPLSISKNFYRDGTGKYDGFVLRHKFEDCMQVLVIKYLHQLQNLYHALTGTEITIKL